MTLPQILSVGLFVAMMAAFVHGRLRYDVVAGLGLVAALALGVVAPADAFNGFADDVVILVGSALVISAAVARSGMMEAALRHVAPYARSTQSQVVLLVTAVTVLSAFIKNIGALAMLMPLAFQIARRGNKSASVFLMPMAFGALIGGIVTMVGTSPNVIVSRVRAEMTGTPFGMFDFTPVGICLALAGIVVLSIGYRLLPRERRGAVTLDEAVTISDYVTDARIEEDSALVGETVADIKKHADGDVTVTALVREGRRRATPLPDAVLHAGDVVILRGESAALDKLVARAKLTLAGGLHPDWEDLADDEIVSVEGVVAPTSMLIGETARRQSLRDRFEVNLLAVSRSGERFSERLRDITLRAGDVVVLQGSKTALPERLRELGVLPLAERAIALGSRRRGVATLAVLAIAIILIAFGVVPVAAGFFSAAVVMLALGSVPPRDAYEAVEWPILVMLACLIPGSDALSKTGATDVLAGHLSQLAGGMPPWAAVGLMLTSAMAVTPFLNNAATVLVMAPIAATFARGLGYQPDAFLMAVAIGAACDFLTPIGHQCNTLVMGPGGYRFGDYARLGTPMSLMVILLGTPLIMMFWPV